MARKTSKDYLKEYNTLQERTKALEARIRNRLTQLVKQCPNAVVGQKATLKREPVLASSLPESLINNMYIITALSYIERIEKYNEKQSGHVQTSIKY